VRVIVTAVNPVEGLVDLDLVPEVAALPHGRVARTGNHSKHR
jgi:hypothetical protein